MLKTTFIFFTVAFTLLVSVDSMAEPVLQGPGIVLVGPVPITKFRTGNAGDVFHIETGQPIVNPANCHNPGDYTAEINAPGYTTYLSTAFMAMAMKKPVSILVSDTYCGTRDRPQIIGITIVP